MNKIFVSILLPLAVVLIGAGCERIETPPVVQPTSTQTVTQPTTTVPTDAVDPYEGWGTIQPGGVISLRIPPGCSGNPGAGSIYVVCPTPGNDTPIPDMQISSDGIQVNIRRWEGLEWEHWNKVVSSLKVLEPLDRTVQINIEK